MNTVACIYLGRKYKLSVVKSDLDCVKLCHGTVHIYSKSNTTAKTVIENWYKRRAQLKFKERLNECLLHLTAIKKMKVPSIIIKFSLSKNKIFHYDDTYCTLLLNVDLIKAPIFFIDYVIYYSIFRFILKNKCISFNFIGMLPENVKKNMSIF
ncbi:MAG: DUF45 domain-containing protein [Wolbachia endosymbiont of Tyrophagus putrescentiae]|nr:DUF45 domain-containing protein [Wolbachia endosymbiont of Tyrophagus putrescentiae]